jgi:hypothetical protein
MKKAALMTLVVAAMTVGALVGCEDKKPAPAPAPAGGGKAPTPPPAPAAPSGAPKTGS